MTNRNNAGKARFGSLLRACREKCRIAARDVPSILERRGVKLSYSTYMGYESGNSMPNADLFLLLCDIYHVQDILSTFGYSDPSASPAALSSDALNVARRYDAAAPALKKAVLSILDLQSSEPEPVPVKAARVIPLLGQRFAAGAAEAPGDLFMEDYETDDEKAEFAIHVNGDSMAPYLADGSIALGVKRLPADGEVGAFWLDGGFLVKQFCSDSEGNVYLFSLNRARSDADVTVRRGADRDLRCVGTILMQRLPLPDK